MAMTRVLVEFDDDKASTLINLLVEKHDVMQFYTDVGHAILNLVELEDSYDNLIDFDFRGRC